jgi:hypothetical protein
MQGIEEPKDNLAAEKIALFRTYLYTEGTLFIVYNAYGKDRMQAD